MQNSALSSSVALDTLGRTVGETYNFDLLFAERHTGGSSFRIDTSIALGDPTPTPEPGTIMGLLSLGLIGLRLIWSRRKCQELDRD